MICRRCGRLASHVHFPGGKTVNPADERKDLDYGAGGGIDAGGLAVARIAATVSSLGVGSGNRTEIGVG
jgi:hypothetical protein